MKDVVSLEDIRRPMEQLLGLGQGRLSLRNLVEIMAGISNCSGPLALVKQSPVKLGYYPWDTLLEGRIGVLPEEKTRIELQIQNTGGFLAKYIQFIDITKNRRGLARGNTLDDILGNAFKPEQEFLMLVDISDPEGLKSAFLKSQIKQSIDQYALHTSPSEASSLLRVCFKNRHSEPTFVT